MREIKFRLIKNNEIVGIEYHKLTFREDQNCIIIYHAQFNKDRDDWERFDITHRPLKYIKHDEKEQYTGKKDFSGYKEIYESDKVDIIRNGKYIFNLTVKWDDAKCGFILDNEEWKIPFWDIEHVEIIGTIHDKDQS